MRNVKKRLSVYSQMQKNGMQWITLRGLKNCRYLAMLTFAAVTLKKMANGT